MNPETVAGGPVGMESLPEEYEALLRVTGAPMPAFGEVEPEIASAIKTAEDETKAKVAGKGIYFEFISENSYGTTTTQVLIITGGVTKSGKAVTSSSIARSVSKWSPRAQWRFRFFEDTRHTASPTLSNSERITKSLEKMVTYLQRQIYYNGSLTLRGGKPFTFEVTSQDYEQILDWKTPDALIRRIQKARIACGFPEKLV